MVDEKLSDFPEENNQVCYFGSILCEAISDFRNDLLRQNEVAKPIYKMSSYHRILNFCDKFEENLREKKKEKNFSSMLDEND